MDENEAIKDAMSTPGYSMQKLAEELGVTFREAPMQNDVAAMFSRPSRREFEIIINSSKRKTARRWAAAHAVSHFLLHRDLLPEGRTHIDTNFTGAPRNGKYDELSGYDEQANRYAIRLLMPQQLIRKSACTTPLAELFKMFQVTPAAMNIRLKDLGIKLGPPRYEGDNIIPWPGNPNSADDHLV